MKNFFEKYKSNLLILFALVSCSKDEIENIEEVYNSTCSGLSYLTRPNPVDSDNTHDYYEYAWQADPKICINVYDVSILGGREKKVQASMDWVKLNLPNIVPINVFYIDQFNASQDAKTQFDTDFCNLIREGNEVEDCIKESAESWGERSYGGGVYNTYLHNGADLMIYDDAFTSIGSSETEDTGIRYLMHEYFHTFQTSHFFFFEERNQFGINKENFQTGKPLPFIPIWMVEGAADFESENYRVGDEFYAYGGGFMAYVYLWHMNENNFKKIIKDFYTIFSEKEKLNPGNGWKDAFEESFNISVEDFYKEFDAFMLQDRDSQISIIKSTDAWENASWN